MSVPHYDLAVIGSGPAGQKGAIAAAKLRKRVVVIDRRDMVGGCSLHLGTIPSKTMREAILYLSGIRQRTFYGADYRAKEDISARDLSQRVDVVLQREIDVVKSQLKRNGVTTINGMARFVDAAYDRDRGQRMARLVDDHGRHDPHRVRYAAGGESVDRHGRASASSTPTSCCICPLIPRELIVVGGGVIGLEYAAMMTALNTRVTLIDQRPTLLDFADHEIIESLCHHLREEGVTFRLGETGAVGDSSNGDRVIAQLESGKTVKGDALLYAVGRQANSDLLRLDAAGIAADERGKITVNEYFQTSVPHIYAAGDVIGFPALAATSMEQGRLAISHSLGLPMKTAPHLLPFGIYTIPGDLDGGANGARTDGGEGARTRSGISRFGELARAQMIGDERGMLKLLFDPDTLRLLGVHVMGESATEIIHIGQAVLAMGGTIDYFRDTVFNYPTLAEAYKVAALNGMNKVA